jgi:hypothetical protein
VAQAFQPVRRAERPLYQFLFQLGNPIASKALALPPYEPKQSLGDKSVPNGAWERGKRQNPVVQAQAKAYGCQQLLRGQN